MRTERTLAVLGLGLLAALPLAAGIYHDGWIDFNKNGRKDVYEDRAQPVEKRVADLLAQMTVEEKTCQLATLYGYGRVLKDPLPTPGWKNEVWKDGIANIDEQLNGVGKGFKTDYDKLYPFSNHARAINTIQRWFIEETRLGIPVDFSNEGIHGLNHTKATPLPAPISIGSTWNRALVRRAGEIAGAEAKALGYSNVYAPILDVVRDPRWGRVLECYGESPFLIAELGVNMVKGIQSQGVGSTLKHYAVYSVPKGGRDGNCRTDPHVSPRELHELFLYPFRRVVLEAHPLGVMCSYNDWNGEPVAASKYFLTDLLRTEYGFDGYVVSDSEAVEFVHTKHAVAETYAEACRQVLEAGLNVRTQFTPPADFILPVRELIRDGRLPMTTVDRRVGEVLSVKFRLGLFDRPFVDDPDAADRIVGMERHLDFVDDIQAQSFVLLKNDGLLPLDRAKTKKVLVTGPLADETNYMISRYGPNGLETVSIRRGLEDYLRGTAEVVYRKGCDTVDPRWPDTELVPTPLSADETAKMDEAVTAAADADVVIAVLGEDEKSCGESRSRTSLELPGRQQAFLERLYATGKPVVLVLVNGQPLTVNWAARKVPAILETWFPGCRGGVAVAKTLFGELNPNGRLSVTFPKTVGQIELNFPFKKGSHGTQPDFGPNGAGHTRVDGVLYPFGHGLSYTKFGYDNLKIEQVEAGWQVSCEVKNVGGREGAEVVQLYVRDRYSSVVTYDSVLRGFEKIWLKPGESRTVTFTLTPDHLKILDCNMKWTVEPGDFDIRVGASSEDIRLHGVLTVSPVRAAPTEISLGDGVRATLCPGRDPALAPFYRTYPKRYLADADTAEQQLALYRELWKHDAKAETRLWPEGRVPYCKGAGKCRLDWNELWQRNIFVRDVNDPFFWFAPAKGVAAAPVVVICPGGGYNGLGWNKEGVEVAEWLNGIGFSAAVLVYRVPQQRRAALADVQRAIRLLRANAGRYSVDPNRIGVIGFSAGANLTVSAATNWKTPAYARVDAADDVSCRPDFQLPIYPWDLRPRTGNSLTIRCEDYPVDAETPPAFVAQAEDDFCRVETSLAYDSALKQAGVKCELHVFKSGGHGYGLRQLGTPCDVWSALAAKWLEQFK